MRLGEIYAERIEPRDLRGSAPDQRHLAIILRSGGVVYFGAGVRSFAVCGTKRHFDNHRSGNYAPRLRLNAVADE